MKGTITRCCRRYGFIKGNDEQSYFFKPTQKFTEGETVTFTPGTDDKGLRADEVKKCSQ